MDDGWMGPAPPYLRVVWVSILRMGKSTGVFRKFGVGDGNAGNRDNIIRCQWDQCPGRI